MDLPTVEFEIEDNRYGLGTCTTFELNVEQAKKLKGQLEAGITKLEIFTSERAMSKIESLQAQINQLKGYTVSLLGERSQDDSNENATNKTRTGWHAD